MVEFALVAALVFIPLVFGIVELGRLSWAKNTITAAAREGVRYAIVHGEASGAAADSAAVANFVKGRTALSPIIVRSAWTGLKKPGDTVTVRVEYTYTPLVKVIPGKTIQGISKQIIAF
jgi:Flp pilus assembly protein TadG